MSTEEALDESLRVPVTAQPSDDGSSDNSEDSEKFSSDDARQMYEKWFKEWPKHNIKMMAVMFMDALIDRFNMTTRGATNEVGLVLSYNEKTIRTWRQDFTESRQGKHAVSSFWTMKVCATKLQSGFTPMQ